MEAHEDQFDPQRYWEQRLQAHPDITGVGYLGRSPKFVEYQYHSRMYQLEKILSRYRLTNLAGRSVLDIGSGNGIWLNFWHKHGASCVVGLDFAQPSIDRLRIQFPDDLILQADVSATSLPLPGGKRFDIISVFDVLLHIVDSSRFKRAIANLAYQCRSGGWLIISDPILQGKAYIPAHSNAVHNKVRSLAQYRDVLMTYGFKIDSIWPTTVLLNTPLEAPNRLTFLTLAAIWKTTALWGRANLWSQLIGPVASRADQIALRFRPEVLSPSSKIIIARKFE